ncbi:MAG: hypothetical protein G01um101419_173 [Parcubacteria group bacterium Gr01-1014_19]|nr:MAG: hypothetical protein G01um101419_173 [Parcubacteria group bacterium Gr01-1014_19]
MSGKKQSEEDCEKSGDLTKVCKAAKEEVDKLEELEGQLAEAKQAHKNDLEVLRSEVGEKITGLQQFCDRIDKAIAKVGEVKLVRRSSAFPIWKTLKLGTHPSAEALRKAIVAKKNKISDWGNDILKRISVSPKETEIDLVKLTVAQLGLTSGGTREQIYAKAKEPGLETCPAEVGPQLRLQYQDQPYGEWILVGMEPIAGSDGLPRVFGVGLSSGVRWLNAYDGYADDFWFPEDVWVFGRRK